MKKIFLIPFFFIPFLVLGQNYTSYFTGNANDTVTIPSGGICLMGGATEDDYAMKWFLKKANGGDVLVLRASGSNGYNSYLYSSLGIYVNSVETIVCHNASASNDPYVIQKIQQAEAIWFAGGNQWNYINYWRNSPVANAINQAIQQRNIVIGGTSAGMAIQGKYYFSAQNGTVTSATALSQPYSNTVTVDSATFIKNSILDNTITDTHFDNPDRKGRLVTFLARIKTDYGMNARAIACDEYTAVCIDTNGIARVYGGHPAYDDNAYFIQSNCELPVQSPETCNATNPLTWNHGGLAIKAYQIKGDSTGGKTFNLNNWQSGTGGTWYHWSVSNGVFNEQSGTEIKCPPLSIHHLPADAEVIIYPNPSSDQFNIVMKNLHVVKNNISFYNQLGQRLNIPIEINSHDILVADFSNMDNGLYYIVVYDQDGKLYHSRFEKK